MKKFLLLFLTVSVMTACNNNPFSKKDDKPKLKDDDKGLVDDNGKDNDNRTGWSKSDKNKYLKQCLDEANNNATAKKVCPRVLEKFEKLYPDVNDAEKATEEEGRNVAMECLEEMGLGKTGGNDDGDNPVVGGGGRDDVDDNNDRNGTNWTTTQRNQFIQGCAIGAQQTFGYTKQQANTYCDCLTRKVEQQYTFQQAARMTAQDFATEEWDRARQDCQPRF